ncbi:hypothetical protein HK099_008561, partial [Clydaea vesicula]
MSIKLVDCYYSSSKSLLCGVLDLTCLNLTVNKLLSISLTLQGISLVCISDSHNEIYDTQKQLTFLLEYPLKVPDNIKDQVLLPFNISITKPMLPSISKEAAFRCGVIGEGSSELSVNYFLTAKVVLHELNNKSTEDVITTTEKIIINGKNRQDVKMCLNNQSFTLKNKADSLLRLNKKIFFPGEKVVLNVNIRNLKKLLKSSLKSFKSFKIKLIQECFLTLSSFEENVRYGRCNIFKLEERNLIKNNIEQIEIRLPESGNALPSGEMNNAWKGLIKF